MRPADVLGLITLATVWGTGFLLVDVALDGLSPSQIVLLRLALGGAGLVLLARLRNIALPRGAGIWLRLAGMGLVGQAVPFVLFAWGQQEVPSSLAGVYNGATPLLTLPVAWLMLRQRPSAGEISAAVLGFVGIAVVLAPGREAPSASLSGQLLCLLGAGCYALAFAYATRLLAAVDGNKIGLAATQGLFGAALMIPVGNTQLAEPLRLTGPVLVAILLLGLGTAVSFLVNYWLIARIGPVRASLAFYLIPVVAVLVGVLGNNERLTLNQVIGAALVIAALGTLYLWNRRQSVPAPTAGPAQGRGLAGPAQGEEPAGPAERTGPAARAEVIGSAGRGAVRNGAP